MTKIEIVCDSTELVAIWGADIPDVIVIGGYALDSEAMPSFLTAVRDVKEELTGSRWVPIKWNMRDLTRALKRHDLESLLPTILEKSDDIRGKLLNLLSEYDATIFISVILAHSNNRQVLGNTKNDLVSYSFGNLLMRLGLYCKSFKDDLSCELTLDWPEGNQRDPFIQEYMTGWKFGSSGSAGQPVQYRCGALKDIGFRSAPSFGITDIDERLQLADLVVGATKAFLNFCMDRVTETDFGVTQFKNISPQLFHDDQMHCFGRGITIAPAKSQFSQMVLDGYKKLLQ